ncbi:MAG: hypothetical protein HYV32_01435 [Candidatus Kerfeldbacteria bacterium]|nr:hypothetical protein [Candidatus Kerfeldbacteria bacterium]
MIKKLLCGIVAFLLLMPTTASAHVKWFVDEDTVIPNPIEHFSLTNSAVIIWIVILFCIILVAWWLDGRLAGLPDAWVKKSTQRRKQLLWIVQLCVGVWLLNTTWHGAVIAPPLHGHSGDLFSQILLGTQLAAGILLIINLLVPLSGALLLLLFTGACITFGFLEMLEHVFVVGLGLFLIIQKSKRRTAIGKKLMWATPLLRVTTGISLITLALDEKLLHPELGLTFLQTHQWNFMQILGMAGFSNQLFILSAGFMELTFGLLFVLGLVTRLNTFAMSIFFIGSAIMLGPREVIGHLPIFAIAMVLLIYGSGTRLKLKRQ